MLMKHIRNHNTYLAVNQPLFFLTDNLLQIYELFKLLRTIENEKRFINLPNILTSSLFGGSI